MAKSEVKEGTVGRRYGLSPPAAKLLLIILAATGASVWLLVPRPVPPVEPPSLVLDRGAVERVRRADQRATGRAPGSEAVLAFERLVREQGRAEVGPGEPPGSFDRRRVELEAAAEVIRQTHGDRGLAALRARATERVEPALAGELSPKNREALIGSYPTMLERYGLVLDGRSIAPPFVVRTLFKARWNGLAGLPLTWRFEAVERRAYWGWLALHAVHADPAMREQALDRYARTGGRRIAEARAVLAYRAGEASRAARWLDRALREHGGFRLRNHAMALLPGGHF